MSLHVMLCHGHIYPSLGCEAQNKMKNSPKRFSCFYAELYMSLKSYKERFSFDNTRNSLCVYQKNNILYYVPENLITTT